MALCVYIGHKLRREARFTAPASLILRGPADLEGKGESWRTGKELGRNPSMVPAVPRIAMESLPRDY